MKKIFLIDNSYPINSRNIRIINSLNKNYEVSIITWNRENRGVIEDSNTYIYNKASIYGNSLDKLIKLYGYFKFIRKTIKTQKPDIVIASHWEIMIIASYLNKNRNFKLVYENLDMPDHSKRVIRVFIRKLEKYYLRRVDGIILASRFFKDFYKKQNTLILENYPNYIQSKPSITEVKSNRIAFIGNIRHLEILSNLIKASYDLNLDVIFYGTGPAENKLKDFCKQYNYTNTIFNGPYSYTDIYKIYSNESNIWAAYPYKSFNVKYAISNKFFEVLLYNKIGFFSKKTKLGEYVTKNNIGLAINPYSVKSIKRGLMTLNNNVLIEEITQNIEEYKLERKLFWESHENKLVDFIEKL